jgi:hypothetical protein
LNHFSLTRLDSGFEPLKVNDLDLIAFSNFKQVFSSVDFVGLDEKNLVFVIEHQSLELHVKCLPNTETPILEI